MTCWAITTTRRKKRLCLSTGCLSHAFVWRHWGIAAHECGHAIQHQKAYAPLELAHGDRSGDDDRSRRSCLSSLWRGPSYTCFGPGHEGAS